MDSRAGYYAAIEDVKRDDINKLIHALRGSVSVIPGPAQGND